MQSFHQNEPKRETIDKDNSWIRSLTQGLAFLLTATGFLTITLLITRCCLYDGDGFLNTYAGAGLLIASVFFAFGIAGIISGILQRKSTLDANQGQ